MEYTLCTVITGAGVGGVVSANVVAVTVLLSADLLPA